MACVHLKLLWTVEMHGLAERREALSHPYRSGMQVWPRLFTAPSSKVHDLVTVRLVAAAQADSAPDGFGAHLIHRIIR
jgi:hypothetical protein